MKFTMIKEDDEPKKYKTVFQRSWTIRTLKHEYGVIVITLLGVAISFLCLYTFVKAEQWILNEKVVTVSPWNYVRGIRTAQAASLTTREYIQLVFGKDTPTALLVANGEGLNYPCDGFNTNTNRSIDVGPFRINSIHFKKPGINVVSMADCHKNVDFAYKLYKEQGWCPWVAYKKLYPNKCK